MRRRLLITLIVAMTASLGAECSGSSGGDAVAIESTTSRQATDKPATPTPEPSAALVFGVGLLTAYLVSRRKQG